MKKQSVILALIILTILATSNSFGQSVREPRNVKGFSQVNFGGSGDLFISFGPGYEVILEGEKKYIDNITTVVEGQKLIIRRRNRVKVSNEKITVYITMPKIDGLGLSGSGKAEITDAINGEDLDLGISGSGKVILADLDLVNLDCGISGSGSVSLTGRGKINNAQVAISGSGSYRGDGIPAETMEVAISGSGNCYCNVEESLEAAISGSGSVIFSGSPKVDAKVSGSGRVMSK